MYERLRDSLIYPEQILNYRKDSIFRILFVLLLYAAIMSLYIIVDTTTFDELNIPTMDYLEEQFVTEDIPCEFNDSVLICDEDTNQLLFNYLDAIGVYVHSGDVVDYSSFDEGSVSMIFHDDELILISFGSPITMKITDLIPAIDDIDFRVIESDQDGFNESLIKIIEDTMVQTKSTWAPIVITMYILLNFLLALLIALITGFFFKTRYKVIPFKETFRFGVYMSSSTYLILGLMNMIGLELFLFVLIIFINSRQMGRVVNAINQVMKK